MLNSAGLARPDDCVERALGSIAHRGPDGAGIWRRSGAGPAVLLGHRRLAIIDLTEAGAQPMVSRQGGQVIVFNGEIYNYRELRQELRGLGHRFESDSDTEVLLAAYAQWGEACVDHLNGMFAFAIWDEARRRLFAARDRFGEKPFYYSLSRSGESFAFASEMKALLSAGVVDFAIDDCALISYVNDEIIDGAVPALIKGICRLLAGQRLVAEWRNEQWVVSTDCYWSLNPARCDLSLGDASERFRDLLEDSVRLRLRADVPVGTSLSGGLDSSSIVCLINRLGAASGQRTFSARMSDPRLDEGRYIHAVLGAVKVEAHEVTPDAKEFQASFRALCWHMEEPFPATSMFAQYMVMKLARHSGTTVLLDGQGADELLGGYLEYYRVQMRWLLRQGRIAEFRDELKKFSELRGGQKVLGTKGILACLLPPSALSWMEARRRGVDFRSWWSPEWIRSSDPHAKRGQRPARTSLDAALRSDALGGPLQSLLRYGDRNSMAWSREVRQPFLDHRLAEFVFSLPPQFKIGAGCTKRILRQAMRGIVPDLILDRHDKLGYQAPLGSWLGLELRSWTTQKLDEAAGFLGGRVDAGVVQRFLNLRGLPHDWREGRHLIRLITLSEAMSQLRECARVGGAYAAATDFAVS